MYIELILISTRLFMTFLEKLFSPIIHVSFDEPRFLNKFVMLKCYCLCICEDNISNIKHPNVHIKCLL